MSTRSSGKRTICLVALALCAILPPAACPATRIVAPLSNPTPTPRAVDRVLFIAARPDPAAIPAPPDPTEAPRKRKAGFLAAAGLIILSLLVLATGLALLRAFRQR